MGLDTRTFMPCEACDGRPSVIFTPSGTGYKARSNSNKKKQKKRQTGKPQRHFCLVCKGEGRRLVDSFGVGRRFAHHVERSESEAIKEAA